MARLELSTPGSRKPGAHAGKSKRGPARKKEVFVEDAYRKHSMEAYYRPRLRGVVDACLREADEPDSEMAADA